MTDVDIAAHEHRRANGVANGELDIDAVATLYTQFLSHLSELERIGEHVAAAYLVAATDVLDRRLAQAGRAVGDRHGGIVADFAQRLATRLGPRAIEVARSQLSRAEGDILVVWTAIVKRLERNIP